MVKILLSTILFCLCLKSIAQQNFTISGRITDSETGEDLINANVYDTITKNGSVSNNFGFYSITLPHGKTRLAWSYIGYETVWKEFELNQDIQLNIALQTNARIQEITITANNSADKSNNSSISRIDLPVTKSPTVFNRTSKRIT